MGIGKYREGECTSLFCLTLINSLYTYSACGSMLGKSGSISVLILLSRPMSQAP